MVYIDARSGDRHATAQCLGARGLWLVVELERWPDERSVPKLLCSSDIDLRVSSASLETACIQGAA